METRTIRFNIKYFLEDLVIYDSCTGRASLLNKFNKVYSESSKRVRDQIDTYLNKSIIYNENPEIKLPIDHIRENFHM